VKEFPIQTFLDSVNGSSQTKTKIKNLVIQSFNEMESIGLVSNKCKLLSKKGEYMDVDK
jgi:hypothetical protein